MRKTFTAAALALGMALGSLGISAAIPASASSSRTYAYALGMGGLWQSGAIPSRTDNVRRPLRRGGIVVVQLVIGYCSRPGAFYGFGSYEANVKLYDVKIHHGRQYFSWIKIAEHGHKTRHLKYSGGLWRTR